MKNLLFALLLLVSINALAQQFEGTIVWSITTEITDPKMKAKMEESKRTMQDPAKIAEMKKQMNDPQFKAMMEQNPQMKEQMERALAMMEGGAESVIPATVELKVKDGNMLHSTKGGMFNNEVLYLKSKDKSYVLNHSSKTYYTSATSTGSENAPEPEVKVTRTGETRKVMGYTCTRYNVEMKQGDHNIKQFIWATEDIKNIDFNALAKQYKRKDNQGFYHKEIKGVPLRVETASPQGNMIMEVTDIKKESLPASDFVIPAGYTEASR